MDRRLAIEPASLRSIAVLHSRNEGVAHRLRKRVVGIGFHDRPRPSSSRTERFPMMIVFRSSLLSLLPMIAVLPACATTGTKPHDMSAAEHQHAAEREEALAGEHAEQYDPTAEKTQECDPAIEANGICWADRMNPTEEHKKEAEKHRELAAKHRAASQALLDAEAKACGGIAESDRDQSPFSHRSDIVSVKQLVEADTVGEKQKKTRHAGATIVFRAVPGMTAEWLQRVVDCHLARNAALGHEVEHMAYCPLVPRGVEAKVRSVGNGFAVDVRSDDAATAEEIWKRAQQLGPSS